MDLYGQLNNIVLSYYCLLIYLLYQPTFQSTLGYPAGYSPLTIILAPYYATPPDQRLHYYTQVGVVTKQLSETVITPSPNMKIVFYSNHRIPFIGVCKNVRLIIGPIKYEIYLFV